MFVLHLIELLALFLRWMLTAKSELFFSFSSFTHAWFNGIWLKSHFANSHLTELLFGSIIFGKKLLIDGHLAYLMLGQYLNELLSSFLRWMLEADSELLFTFNSCTKIGFCDFWSKSN
jgi:hypothetical protein